MAEKTVEPNAARTGLPHAGRMGAARGHLARMAAQSRRLAGQIRSPFRGSTRRSSGCSPRTSGFTWSSKMPAPRSACGASLSAPAQISTRCASIAGPPTALDPRLRADLCPQCEGPGRPHRLALQRLGQVRRLAARRQAARPSAAKALKLLSWQPLSPKRERREARLFSKAGRSIPMARECCSPPRSAC